MREKKNHSRVRHRHGKVNNWMDAEIKLNETILMLVRFS